MTPAAWLCIGYTIGAALAAIAGWAARRPLRLFAPICWLRGHDDEPINPFGVPFAPDLQCRRCGRFL